MEVRRHIYLKQGCMDDQLKRVEEHPRWQESTTDADKEDKHVSLFSLSYFLNIFTDSIDWGEEREEKPEVTDSAADVEVSVSKGDQSVLAGDHIIICHIF